MKQETTNATLYIASPEMCDEEKPYSFMGQVNVQQSHVQVVALNCRKRDEIPSKLRSILDDIGKLPPHSQIAERKSFFEQSLTHIGTPPARSSKHFLNIMPQLSTELLYIDK